MINNIRSSLTVEVQQYGNITKNIGGDGRNIDINSCFSRFYGNLFNIFLEEKEK
jgi:hypothetical protein